MADLGAAFAVQSLTTGKAVSAADAARFTVTPGVYILSARGIVDVKKLPKTVGKLGLAEYYAPLP